MDREIAARRPPRAPRRPVLASASEPRNVLIVDDEESTRILLGHITSQDLGARVALAGTCEAALHLAGEHVYDAILLDLMMPGIGGFEVLRRLRAVGPNRKTPILVVSVLSSHETIERCRLLGATAFVAKPIDRELVSTVLKSVLSPRRPKGPGSAR
ncbi:MAG: response regulator [Burkholderiales bacterium]